MAGRTILNVGLGTGRGRHMRSGDDALRILVVGAFSGRPAIGVEEAMPPPGKPIPIDIDTFDAIMARLAPGVHLADTNVMSDALDLSFTNLDDFHPDSLFGRLPLFQDLRTLQARLTDPRTFGETAAILKQGAGPPPQTSGAGKPSPSEDEGAMLERLLGAPPREAKTKDHRGSLLSGALKRHLRDLVAPSVLPAIGQEQTLLLNAIDDRIAAVMRAVLHHPDVQRLEAAWRGLYWLVSSIEEDEAVAVFLLDIDPASVAAAGDFGMRDGCRWSLIVVNRSFGPAETDLSLLSELGTIATATGAALLAAADPELLGCPNLAERPDPPDWRPLEAGMAQHWQALRDSAAAASISLVLPRVLLRLPYGVKSEPVERFTFEELPGAESHSSYLWGNPALAAAILIARAFQDRGWSMTLNDVLELGDLPAHTFVGADGPELKPCAEVYLTDIAAEAVLAQGIMPFLSHRYRNIVRLARFQSIAEPFQALAGPWS